MIDMRSFGICLAHQSMKVDGLHLLADPHYSTGIAVLMTAPTMPLCDLSLVSIDEERVAEARRYYRYACASYVLIAVRISNWQFWKSLRQGSSSPKAYSNARAGIAGSLSASAIGEDWRIRPRTSGIFSEERPDRRSPLRRPLRVRRRSQSCLSIVL